MSAAPRVKESEMLAWVRPFLEKLGYSVYASPDGADYFDVVAVRDQEVGLVELKVADWKHVVTQAVDRRDWADWVAVALPRASLAQRVLTKTANGPGRRIGVWVVQSDRLDVLRLATSPGPSATVSEQRWRHRLKELLDDTAGAQLPGDVHWSVGRPDRRRGSWRLEDFESHGARVDRDSADSGTEDERAVATPPSG
jgi:hypothetical protein